MIHAGVSAHGRKGFPSMPIREGKLRRHLVVSLIGGNRVQDSTESLALSTRKKTGKQKRRVRFIYLQAQSLQFGYAPLMVGKDTWESTGKTIMGNTGNWLCFVFLLNKVRRSLNTREIVQCSQKVLIVMPNQPRSI